MFLVCEAAGEVRRGDASSQRMFCDVRVILNQVLDLFLLNFYPGEAADPAFDKHFQGLKLLLQTKNGKL